MNPLIDTSEWNEDELKLFCTYLAGGGYYLLRQWLLDSPFENTGRNDRYAVSFYR